MEGGGRYGIYLSSANYLTKKYPSIALTEGTLNTQDFTNIALTPGDFNADNKFDILDIGKILSIYTTLVTQVTSSNQIYDVNGDAVINITDVAIVLSNYTQLSLSGD